MTEDRTRAPEQSELLVEKLRRHTHDLVQPGGTNATELRDNLNDAADLLTAQAAQVAQVSAERNQLEQSAIDCGCAIRGSSEGLKVYNPRAEAAEQQLAQVSAERDAAYAQLRSTGYVPYLDRMAELVKRAEAAEEKNAQFDEKLRKLDTALASFLAGFEEKS